jgi:hypothetical protein
LSDDDEEFPIDGQEICMCKFTGAPCDSPIYDREGRPACVVQESSASGMKGGCCYYCEHIRFLGGEHWGISIKEKVERQKLLENDEGGCL